MILGSLSLFFVFVARAFANDVGSDYHPLTYNLDTGESKFDVKTWETQYGSYPFHSYRSSNLTSPAVRKATDSIQCYDDNLIFLSPRGKKVANPAVTILDNHGRLIWSKHVQGQAYNLKVQEYKGEKVLTYWVGDDAVGGHGEGYFYVLNTKYEEIARIRGVNDLRADLHELTITPEGTAIVTFYQIYPLNQPGVFRIKDTVYISDCLFQEFDIATQKLVFEWRASDHHALNESYALIGTDGYTMEHPFDWYHINSVQKDDLGNYLVSARFTNSITYINGRTGEIIWILGGKRNSFSDLSNGQATNMQYQHLARFAPLTTFPFLMAKEIAEHGKRTHKDGTTKQLLTLFDNGIPPRPARGLILELTYPTPGSASTNVPLTAKLIKAYEHPLQIDSVSQGSLQVVHSNLTAHSDPHVMLGFGWQGTWTEYFANGTLLCDSRIVVEASMQSPGKGDVQSYSVLKFPWQGLPHYPPEAAPSRDQKSVFVNWNGATGVFAWRLSFMVDEQWQMHRKELKQGFETEIDLPHDIGKPLRYVVVEALDESDKVLGKTEIVDLWQRGLRSRISQMAPMGNGLLLVVAAVVFAVLAFVVDRVVKSRRSGSGLDAHQKLRRH